MSLLRIKGKGMFLFKFDLQNSRQRYVKLHNITGSVLSFPSKRNCSLWKLTKSNNYAIEVSKLTWCQQRYFNQSKAKSSLQLKLHTDNEFAEFFDQVELEGNERLDFLESASINYEDIKVLKTEGWDKNSAELTKNPCKSEHTQPKTKSIKFQTRFESELLNSSKTLHNFLQACIHSNLNEDAFKRFHVFAQQKASSVDIKIFELMFLSILNTPQSRITDPSICLNKLDTLFHFLNSYELQPTPFISACCIGSLIKYMDIDQSGLIDFFKKMIPGHSYSDCLNVCHPDSDTYKYCRKAILLMSPDFEFVPPSLKGEENHTPLIKEIGGKKSTVNAMLLKSELEGLDIKKLFDEQLSQEINQVVSIPRVLRNSTHSSDYIKDNREKLTGLHKTWMTSLVQGIKDCKEYERVRWSGSLSFRKGLLYPFLCLLPHEQYAQIIMSKLYQMPKNGEITLLTCVDLGQAVYNRYAVEQLLENGSDKRLKQIHEEYMQLYTNENITSSPREYWKDLVAKYGDVRSECTTEQWKDLWKLSVGKKLLEIMISVLTFEVGSRKSMVPPAYVSSPAVFNSYKAWGKKMYGMTLPHPHYVKLVKDAAHHFSFSNSFLPMVVPPTPWLNPDHGGFLLTPTDFVRQVDNSAHAKNCIVNHRNVSPVVDSLNVLNSVAWKINKRVLDIQLEIFRSKGDVTLQIPRAVEKDLPIATSLHSSNEVDHTKRKIQQFKLLQMKKTHREMYALFMDGLYKFSIANHYRDKIIWLPHNLDFRGRMYPVPPHFNYMGSDVNRALFLFANGKPLGRRGLDWLKVHIINLTGFKKMSSLSDRLKYADEVLDKIMDSADNPLNGEGWWKLSDEPWQTLVACIELTEALCSADPEQYVSCMPVYQDGSCNGLQHYAAMGRDVEGAEQVNLSPFKTPRDVYSKVAEKVEERRAADAEKGHELAILLDGFIKRKVVKQSIMTSVYGVTKFGATQQIKRQLQVSGTIPVNKILSASNYTCILLFESLASMFTGASQIQEWFTSLARCMSNNGHSMEWVTPLGLHVIQPYFKMETMKIRSSIQAFNYQYPNTKPNTRKQCNAFPANFVHSLDSTHMMLTALHCQHKGIKFNAIHDCYWTHACDIDAMNVICRDQFVKLHSQPILQDLSKHLSHFVNFDSQEDEQFRKLLKQIPPKGGFNLDDVRKSTFFFS